MIIRYIADDIYDGWMKMILRFFFLFSNALFGILSFDKWTLNTFISQRYFFNDTEKCMTWEVAFFSATKKYCNKKFESGPFLFKIFLKIDVF